MEGKELCRKFLKNNFSHTACILYHRYDSFFREIDIDTCQINVRRTRHNLSVLIWKKQ